MPAITITICPVSKSLAETLPLAQHRMGSARECKGLWEAASLQQRRHHQQSGMVDIHPAWMCHLTVSHVSCLQHLIEVDSSSKLLLYSSPSATSNLTTQHFSSASVHTSDVPPLLDRSICKHPTEPTDLGLQYRLPIAVETAKTAWLLR